jgi:hypothetical protein
MTRMPPDDCPICGSKSCEGYPAGRDLAGFNCKVCGSFTITGTKLHLLRADDHKGNRFKLSGMTRLASERGHPLRLGTDNTEELIKTAPAPRTPMEAMDRLLLVIHDSMVSLTGGVILENSDYPLVFARNLAEFSDLLRLMESVGWISTQREANWQCSLTLLGWQRISELRRVGRVSDQAFVAMWFNPEMTEAWTEGIQPGLHEAGYRAIRVDRVEYNEKIDDRIIAEIRRSGLVVADFTGDRGGVYYEAGFAQGLGLPVIFTVRKDEISRVHFDTRQYNHITWETPGELRERLRDRVLATLGSGVANATTA